VIYFSQGNKMYSI